MTVAALLVGGTELFITADGDEDITVRASTNTATLGQVEILVGSTERGIAQTQFGVLQVVQASALSSIKIDGGSEANQIDLSRVSVTNGFNATLTILVNGENGDDLLIGSPDHANELHGGDGKDEIRGGDVGDTLDGGDGADTIFGDLIPVGTVDPTTLANGGNDTITGGDGSDTIQGGGGNDSIDSGDSGDLVNGGAGDDSVYGDNGSDSLFGNAGNDTLNGDGGTDSISGGDGNDSILGGEFNDTLQGDAGNDTINGQAGTDVINGNLGDDSILGDVSSDILHGDEGNDFINGGSGDDEIHGEDGNDTIFGGAGRDIIDGDNGNDTIRGQGGQDTLRGGGGADDIEGGDDNDLIRGNPPGVTIGDIAVAEGDGGATNAVFTVSLSEAFDIPVTVDFRTEDETARIIDNDYVRSTGRLVFAPGVTTQTVTVVVNGDGFSELAETFRVVLYAPVDGTPTNAILADNIGVATISSDATTDILARVSVGDAEVLEGTPPNGAPTLTFSVNLSAPSTQSVVVNFTTQNFQAVAVTDYVTTSGTLTFAPGVTQQTVTVQGVADNRVELDEAFRLVLTAGQNAIIEDGDGLGTLINDDGARRPGILSIPATGNRVDVLDPTTLSVNFSYAAPVGVTLNSTGFNSLAFDGTFVYLIPSGGASLFRLDTTAFNPTFTLVAQISDVIGEIHGLAVLQNAANQVRLYVLDHGFSEDRILEVDPTAAPTAGVITTENIYIIDILSIVANSADRFNNFIFNAGRRNGDSYQLGLAGFENGNADRLFVLNSNTLTGTNDSAAGVRQSIPNIDIVELSLLPSLVAQVEDFTSVTVRHVSGERFRPRNLGTPTALGAVALDPTNPAGLPVLYVATTDASGGAAVNRVLQFTTIGQIENPAASAQRFLRSQTVTAAISDFGADYTPGNRNQSQIPTPPGSIPVELVSPIQLTTGIGDGALTVGVDEFGAFGTEVILNGLNPDRDAVFDPIGSGVAEGTTFDSGVAVRVGNTGVRDFLAVGAIFGSGNTRPIPAIETRTQNQVQTSFTRSGFTWQLQQSTDRLFDRNNSNIGSQLTQVYTITNPTTAPASLELVRYFDGDLGFDGSNGIDAGGQLVAPDGRRFLFETDALGTPRVSDNYVAVTAFLESASTRSLIPATVSRFAVDQFANVLIDVIAGNNLSNAVFGDLPPVDGFIDGAPYDVTFGLSNLFTLEAGQTIRYVTQTFFGTGAPSDLFIDQDSSVSQNDTLTGGAGNDIVVGGIGDQLISGGSGDDSILAGQGNDTVFGGAGKDTLDGQEGDDLLFGQGGADLLIGGEGTDTFIWNSQSDGKDTVIGTNGADELQAIGDGASNVISVTGVGEELLITSGGNSVLTAPTITRVTIMGRSGDDTITVGNLQDTRLMLLDIRGEGGDDNISALGGVAGGVRMLIDGGEGNDSLTGGNGRDTLQGGNGNDRVFGGDGNDLISGGAGLDVVDGQAGDDTVLGDTAADTVPGTESGGADTIRGGTGNDLLQGGGGNDSLDGGDGNDTLQGNDGADTLTGLAGNDSLLGGSGMDSLLGGDGNDTVDGGRNEDTVLGGAGNDRILGDHGNDSLSGGDGNDTILGGDGNDTISGDAGNDAVFGGDGSDVVNGGMGDDTIIGGDGNDTLLGGAGSDLMLGRDGDDLVNGQGGVDKVAGNQGADTLIADPGEIDEAFLLSSLSASLLSALGIQV